MFQGIGEFTGYFLTTLRNMRGQWAQPAYDVVKSDAERLPARNSRSTWRIMNGRKYRS
jgi:hypothetical protein